MPPIGELVWRLVPGEVERRVKEAAPAAAAIRRAAAKLPGSSGYGQIFYHPKRRTAWVVLGDGDEQDLHDAYRAALESVPDVSEVRTEAEGFPPKDERERGEWIRVKRGVTLSDIAIPIRRALGHAALPIGELPRWPSPLAATLVGSAVGGGLGYGAGTLVERLMPDTWKRDRLRRTLAVLGAAGLGLPGLVYYGMNRAEGKGWLDPGTWSRVRGDSPIQRSGATTIAAQHTKIGEEFPPLSAGAFFSPHIEVDSFNNVVWRDSRTPPPIQAATTGLVTAASLQRGDFGARSPLVSPADIANIAVGAGSGYLSGAVVGRALGALAGLPNSAQKRLQDVGLWSGVLVRVVPMAFGN